ncbi:MAG: sigma-70 family RNA polymerase sigma factor [Candidatus Gastranaerophilaceae bacterium]
MNRKLQKYTDIVETVAKIEQRRVPAHMVEFEELMSIGIIAVQEIIEGKTDEELSRYNTSYIATAVRWAIRNELRNRYKWYSLKHTINKSSPAEVEEGLDVSPGKVREAIYETILSIDGMASAGSDNDSPFDFIKDPAAQPDEKAEISELGQAIREAIASLPQKDRIVVEYRFYRNMQVKEIAAQIGLSSSRVTRIVQQALNYVKEYLTKSDHAY